MKNNIQSKCTKCRRYYRTMSIPGVMTSYNPAPFCHLFEETGKHPMPLTQECFAPRKQITKRKEHHHASRSVHE